MYEKQIKKIVANIKKRRNELGYSQQYVADRLFITQNVYSKIESEHIKLTVCRLLLICEILHIDPVDVIKTKL